MTIIYQEYSWTFTIQAKDS